MKRICAIFLAFSILLSLSGCEVNFDKEEFREHIRGEISGAINGAMEQVKNDVSSKTDELMEKAKEQANKIVDSVVDMPKHLWKIMFHGGSSSDEKGTIEGCTCVSFEYEMVSSTHWWPLTWTDDTYVIKCKDCGSPCPVENLTFSVYLKCIYDGKDPTQLSQKKKDKALNTYIRSKAWMAADEMSDVKIEAEKFKSPENLGAFEFYAVIAGTPGDIKEKIPGLNSEAFFLFQNYLPAAFSDAKVESPFLDIVGDVGSVCDFVQLCGAAETSTKAGEHYNKVKNRGPGDTYGIRQAYIDASVSNANLMAAFTEFLGIYDVSSGSPSVDVEDISKRLKSVFKNYDLANTYMLLSSSLSTINGSTSINDVLKTHGFTPFEEIQTYTTENIEDAMRKGPTSKEIAEAIPYIISETNPSEKGLREKMAYLLWYYYGWRQEYEYAKFIEWIYADEPGTFQSYLKGE